VGWFHVRQWRVLVNTKMKLQVLLKANNKRLLDCQEVLYSMEITDTTLNDFSNLRLKFYNTFFLWNGGRTLQLA
jgi:hypothetical protein